MIGQIILKVLSSNARIAVTVLSRQESSGTTEFPPGVTVHKTDFSPSSLQSILRGQDVLISAVGGTAFTEQKKFVDAAIEAGVKRFIPSEFSTSSEDDAVIQLLPLFQQKRDIIDYMKEKEKNGLSWTAIATSGLFDWVSCLLLPYLGYVMTDRYSRDLHLVSSALTSRRSLQ